MNDEMISRADAPLRSVGVDPEAVKLLADTDIALDGHSEQQWLAVTEREITVLAGEPAAFSRNVAWSDVQAVRTVAGVGSGLLQVLVDDEWTDLLRFSNAFSRRFHKISRRLDQWCEYLRDAADAGCDETAIEPVRWPSKAVENPDRNGATAVEGHCTKDEPKTFDDVMSDDEPLDPPKCPSCFLRLPKNAESCPRCLQKGKILKRVGDLLAPHWKGALVLIGLTIVGVIAELIPPKLQQ